MSCDTESWVNTTLDEAIDTLAKRASIARLLRKAETEKKANILTEVIAANPGLASTLGGAALGAGVGGVSSMFTPKDRRNTQGSMLTGALGGAALGGGAYLGSQMLGGASDKLRTSPDAFNFLAGGVERQLNPEAIKNSPELVKEIEKLRSRSPLTQAVGGTWDFFKDYARNHPILGTILAGDVVSHGLGSAANLVTREPSVNPTHFREGVLRSLSDDGKNGPLVGLASKSREALGKMMATTSDDGLAGLLAKARSTGGLDVDGGADGFKLPTDRIRSITDHGAGHVRAFTPQVAYDLAAKIKGSVPKSIADRLGIDNSPQALNKVRAMGTGFTEAGEEAGGLANALKRWANKGGFKVPGARYNMATRLGPRAALYLGVPALQGYAGLASQESANNKRLQELIEQLSNPVQPGV